MTRKLSIILCSCLLLFACVQDKPKPDYFGKDEPAREFSKSEEISITVNPKEGDGEIKERMWKKARDKGMEKVLRSFVQERYLFQGGMDDSMRASDIHFMRRSGSLDPEKAPVTGDLIQDFRIEARLVPDWKLIGKIVKLEKDRYVAGQEDRCLAVSIDYCPSSPPAYFLVAQPKQEMGKNLLEVIGSGKLSQSLKHTTKVQVDKKFKGSIVQIELLETSEEVMKGDVIVWLQARMSALPREVAPSEPTQTRDEEEVVVQPEFRDTQKGPEVSK